MANDEYGDKTEDPTERRRIEAREKGNIARSTDLTAAGLMMAAATAMLLFGVSFSRAMASLMRVSLTEPAWTRIDQTLMVQRYQDISAVLSNAVLPLMLAMMGGALLINFLQVGFLLAPEALQPKFSRLSPLAGAQRILSLSSLVKLAVSVGKLLLLTSIATWSVATFIPQFMSLMELEPPIILMAIQQSGATLAFQLAGALLILAVLDYGYQRYRFEQDLKMTKQEVREEMKNMEGDPQIRQRRRDAHRKLASARELGRVRDADVIITNPTHIAVAIKYDAEKMAAPIVVAKGMGEVAERIRRIATENSIPIIERKPLARELYRRVKVGHPIPVEMYEVFVEIMAYVYRLTGRTPTSLS
jgi:flagellar biosynthetic protein FlhB